MLHDRQTNDRPSEASSKIPQNSFKKKPASAHPRAKRSNQTKTENPLTVILFQEIISDPWKLLEIDRVFGMETVSNF